MILEDSKMQKPTKPCGNCGGNKWWQRIPEGHYVCEICYPDPYAIKVEENK